MMTRSRRQRLATPVVLLAVASGIFLCLRTHGARLWHPDTILKADSLGAPADPNVPRREIVPAARRPVLHMDRRPIGVPAPCAISLSGSAGIESAQAEIFAVVGGEVLEEPLAGAEGHGRVDLPASSELPELLMLSAPGAAHTLIETSCPGLISARLRPEAKVSGVVRLHESGAPVSDADVVLDLGRAKLRVKTAANGEFNLSGVPSGLHQLVAQTDELRGSLETPLALVEGTHVRNADIYLDKAYTLHLKIITGDAPSTEKYSVKIGSSRDGNMRITSTAGNLFQIGPLREGQYQIVVSSDDTHCAATMLRAVSSASVTKNEQEVILDIGPRHQVMIVGSDAEGGPTARIPLILTQESLRKDGLLDKIQRTALTDQSGNALICGVPNGDLGIEVQGNTYTLKVPDDLSLRLQNLERGSRLYGSIVTSEGLPVTGKDLLMIPLMPSTKALTGQSDASGRFAFEHVLPGSYRLEVRPRLSRRGDLQASQNLAQKPELVEDVEVRRNEDLEAELILPQTDTSKISGKILSSDGSPVGGTMITYGIDAGGCWPPWDSGSVSTVSDASGAFVLSEVEGGTPLRLHALHPTLGRGSVGEVDPSGATDITIRLSTLASVEIQASEILDFTQLHALCIALITDESGCTLAGVPLPSDGSSTVLHDLPATSVEISLVCPREKEKPSVRTSLTASQVTKVDLLPRRL